MRSGSITVSNSCGESATVLVSQAAPSGGGGEDETGSVSVTINLTAARCCNGVAPTGCTGALTLEGSSGETFGKSVKIPFTRIALGRAVTVSTDVPVGEYGGVVTINSISCSGTTLATGFQSVTSSTVTYSVKKNVRTNGSFTLTSQCN